MLNYFSKWDITSVDSMLAFYLLQKFNKIIKTFNVERSMPIVYGISILYLFYDAM